MVRLIDLLEIIDVEEINLIASDGPKVVVRKTDIEESLSQNNVIGIGVDIVAGKHVLTMRLGSKQPVNMDSYSFEVGF